MSLLFVTKRDSLGDAYLDCLQSSQCLFWMLRDLIMDQRQGIVNGIELLNLHWDLDCYNSQMDYKELQEIGCALRIHKDVIQGNTSLILMDKSKIQEQDR
jgi:hypothetical protein